MQVMLLRDGVAWLDTEILYCGMDYYTSTINIDYEKRRKRRVERTNWSIYVALYFYTHL